LPGTAGFRIGQGNVGIGQHREIGELIDFGANRAQKQSNHKRCVIHLTCSLVKILSNPADDVAAEDYDDN
jgi:hypothetical protein